MQLVSNDSLKEDISENEPILCQFDISQRYEECSSSCEITTVEGDCVVDSDNLDTNVDETSNLVNADYPQCRICLDIGGDDLISPCHCKGTQKYVHRSCLDNWRSIKEGFAFAHCTECRALFILRANVPPDRWWLRLKFQFFVARDHAFIFVTVQLIVAFLGLLVYKFYGEELREMFGYDDHPYGFYTMAAWWFYSFNLFTDSDMGFRVYHLEVILSAVLAIVLVGLLYSFFIAIICGQRINERHYHVLAKQELTKEYVVEDQEDIKNIPELDTSHVIELKMLGLY